MRFFFFYTMVSMMGDNTMRFSFLLCHHRKPFVSDIKMPQRGARIFDTLLLKEPGHKSAFTSILTHCPPPDYNWDFKSQAPVASPSSFLLSRIREGEPELGAEQAEEGGHGPRV